MLITLWSLPPGHEGPTKSPPFTACLLFLGTWLNAICRRICHTKVQHQLKCLALLAKFVGLSCRIIWNYMSFAVSVGSVLTWCIFLINTCNTTNYSSIGLLVTQELLGDRVALLRDCSVGSRWGAEKHIFALGPPNWVKPVMSQAGFRASEDMQVSHCNTASISP